MSNLMTRAITKDGSARAYILNSTNMVNDAIAIHKTQPTATALLGRLLTATSIMGTMLPEAGNRITVTIKGDGLAGRTLCCGDYFGNVKGYISNPFADLPPKKNGKLDVSGIVGKGILYVSKDVGDEEPYNGTVELVSGEVAEDIVQYYAISEQIPTLCALGVLVDVDHLCKAAGGIIVQLLPFADEKVIARLEENAKQLNNISLKFAQGLSNEDILNIALNGIEYDIFDTLNVDYKCDCSRERTSRALLSLGKKEVEDILREQKEKGDEKIEVECHFCNKKYIYTREDALSLFEKSKKS